MEELTGITLLLPRRERERKRENRGRNGGRGRKREDILRGSTVIYEEAASNVCGGVGGCGGGLLLQ